MCGYFVNIYEFRTNSNKEIKEKLHWLKLVSKIILTRYKFSVDKTGKSIVKIFLTNTI